VKEQSHKTEMSAAIRGDFQRLRDRGVAATLAPREDEDDASPDPATARIELLEPEAPEVPEVAHVPEPVLGDSTEPSVVPDREVVETEAADVPPGGRTGLLARLLGR